MKHVRMGKGKTLHRFIFFVHFPDGPWICEKCGNPILEKTNVDVHHRNGNSLDNRIENLGAMHHSCHISHHHATGDRTTTPWPKGKPFSKEHKEKLRVAALARWARKREEQRIEIDKKLGRLQ